MRLDFNVLWLEDQPDRVAAQVKPIARRMEEDGFEFRPRFCRTMDEVRASIADHVFKDEIDLILVDWDLGGGLEGQQAIAEIRETIQYKDVIFYSANTNPAQLRELVFKEGQEGVYCATRDDLVNEIVGVFQSLVKKVPDLDHMRGIVMGATSDIDFTVNECLVVIHQRYDDTRRAAVVAEALKAIDDRVATIAKKIEGLRENATLDALIADHFVFNANDRLRMLSRALKTDLFKGLAEARPGVTKYLQEVVPERNDLAHKVFLPEGKPVAVADSHGEQISLDQLRDLRRTILALRADFRGLLDGLRNPT